MGRKSTYSESYPPEAVAKSQEHLFHTMPTLLHRAMNIARTSK
jgi:hypothetical protein